MENPLLGERTRRRLSFLINFVFWALWIVLLFALGRVLTRMLLPFVTAFTLAALLQRPMRFLEKRFSFTHGFAATVVSLFILILIGGVVMVGCYQGGAFLFRLLKQEETLAALQTCGNSIKAALANLADNLSAFVSPEISAAAAQAVESLEQTVLEYGAGWLASFSGNMLTFITGSLPRFLLATLFFILALVFFTRDYTQVTAFLTRQIPVPQRPLVRAAVTALRETTLSVGKAYLLLGGITFAEMTVGFLLLKLPLPILLAFLTAIVDALPILGVGTVLLPLAVFRFLSGNIAGGIAVLVLYGIATATRNFLQPRLISRETGLPPLITLLAMYAGWRLVGFIGLLAAPILAMVLLRLQREGHLHIFK